MASPERQDGADLDETIAALVAQPQRYSFFQAVRLIEGAARRQNRDPRFEPLAGIGEDGAPAQEIVRLASSPRLGFPGREIESVEPPTPGMPTRLTVAFLGLVGRSGALPPHFSEIILSRRRVRDRAPMEFFNLFHHRLLSLFYRAWRKYRLPIAYELAEERGSDTQSRLLKALIGLGSPAMLNRMATPDDELVGLAPLLSRRGSGALSLKLGLEIILGVPVEIQPFQPGWIKIPPAERTRVSGLPLHSGQFAQLGVDAVLGETAWDCQSRFRIRIGAVTYAQFRQFFDPAGPMNKLIDFTRLLVGPATAFDTQLVLQSREVPMLRLNEARRPRLGCDTWLKSVGHAHDPDDCVLRGVVGSAG